LWESASWQAQYRQGLDASYGYKSVKQYLQRPEFELYDIQSDPDERKNLVEQPEYFAVLDKYKKQMKKLQIQLHDPWRVQWDR
jgi:N-sulfoglucosamine sulfohydrolase